MILLESRKTGEAPYVEAAAPKIKAKEEPVTEEVNEDDIPF